MQIVLKILIFALILSACSPVRDTMYSKRLKSNKENNEAILDKKNSESTLKESEVNFENDISESNTDTSKIILPTMELPDNRLIDNSKEISLELDAAVHKFNDGLYDEACKEFKLLNETLKEYDSLYYESLFYSGECMIAKKEYILAKFSFEDMLGLNLNSDIAQRTNLRLGHIECALGNKMRAQAYFDQVLMLNPNSDYKKLLNCDL